MDQVTTTNGQPLDVFDRTIGALHGVPDVIKTKPTSFQVVVPLIGTPQTYIVQTYRHKELGDTIFVQCASSTGLVRMMLPPRVAQAVARQRDALSGKSRSMSAKERAQENKRNGVVPGFMRKKAAGVDAGAKNSGSRRSRPVARPS